MTRSSRGARRGFSVLALSLAAAALAACGSDSGDEAGAASGETYEFVVNGISPADNPNSISLQEYLDGVEDASDGRITFEEHWAGELVPTTEALDAVGQGTIDMLLSQASYYVDAVPLGGWSDVPIYPEDLAAPLNAYFETDIASIMDDAYEGVGAEVIGPRLVSPYVFIMGEGQDVTTVDDFQGKKIRSAGGPQSQILEAVGAVPVELEAGDFYSALQQGVVDGFILPLYALESYELGELAGSVTLPGIGVVASQMLWMNNDQWDALPEDLQELFDTTAAEDIAAQAAFVAEQESDATAYAEEAGVELITMSEEEQQRLRELTSEPVIDSFVETAGDDGATVVELLEQGG